MDTLDSTDLQLLRLLQENARYTTKELAAKVHLSTTPVYERLKRLEREGFVKKYQAVLDADKLNQGFIVFCNVKLAKMSHDIAAQFVEKVKAIEEVTECYNVSGRFDYLLKIHAPDMKYYQEFLLNVIGTIESLGSVESTFVMAEVKQDYSIPIKDASKNRRAIARMENYK
ncbi:MAG: Lrp/AsnC family transcriptional regulator [Bacteroidales bacterium]|nr:Lrp/AsnC family transcriptional regulator [Bacteroidales bacterium]